MHGQTTPDILKVEYSDSGNEKQTGSNATSNFP